MSRLPAAAIVRLSYAPSCDEEARAWRFGLFKTDVLPRILSQADVWVWVDPRHEAEVRAMHPRVHTFTVDRSHPGVVRFDNTTLTGHPWAAVRGLPRYPLQVLMGSDDLLGPDFVRTALEALADVHEPRALVTFQPLMIEWSSRRVYAMKQWDRPSPFVVLRQPPDDSAYTWVWAADHRHLGRLVQRVVHIAEGHVLMAVHDHNDGTHLHRRAQQLEAGVPWL